MPCLVSTPFALSGSPNVQLCHGDSLGLSLHSVTKLSCRNVMQAYPLTSSVSSLLVSSWRMGAHW